MDNFQIETAQNVNIVQNVAGLGDRILAYLIDFLILAAYVFAVVVIFMAIDLPSDSEFLIYITISLPVVTYHLLWETFWDGRSPGKRAMNLKVVKLDGSKPSFSNYLLRWLLRVIDLTSTGGSLALVSILFNGKGQRVGDIAAGTTVISENAVVGLAQTVLVDIPEGYVPMYPQVTVFTDHEMQTIKNLFQSARYGGNHHVILKLSNRVSKVMEITVEETPIKFLDKVIKDYNYYTQNM